MFIKTKKNQILKKNELKNRKDKSRKKNFAAIESTRKRKKDDEKNEGMMGVLRDPFIAL